MGFSFVPRLTNGCGCCTLKTCCNVQGYFMLFSSIVLIGGRIVFINTFASCNESNECNGIQVLLDIIFIIVLVEQVLVLVSTIFFLRGIYHRRPKLMQPYLCCLRVFLVMLTLAAILSLLNWNTVLVVGLLVKMLFYYFLLANAQSLYLDFMETPDTSRLVEEVEGGVDAAPPAYNLLTVSPSSSKT